MFKKSKKNKEVMETQDVTPKAESSSHAPSVDVDTGDVKQPSGSQSPGDVEHAEPEKKQKDEESVEHPVPSMLLQVTPDDTGNNLTDQDETADVLLADESTKIEESEKSLFSPSSKPIKSIELAVEDVFLQGRSSAEVKLEGETPEGETPKGEIQAGETPEGKIPEGETPKEQSSDDNDVEKIIGGTKIWELNTVEQISEGNQEVVAPKVSHDTVLQVKQTEWRLETYGDIYTLWLIEAINYPSTGP